jgi:hypothetical protein
MAEAVERPIASDAQRALSAEAIANDTGTALDVVREIYEQELAQLASDAKITQYLDVLASRRVRLLLRKH